MSVIHALQPSYSLAAFFVGVLVGMTGVGGGALMTPILILLFGIHPATAVGTDLLYAAVTKTAGSAVHHFNGTIEWRVVRRLAAGSIPMTIVMLFVLKNLDVKSAAGLDLINAALTIALLITAVALVFRERIVNRCAPRLAMLGSRPVGILTVAVGAVLGTIVSISSVGAGAIGVTCLVLLYPGLPTARIVGSDIAHAVPLTLVGGIGHWWLGTVDFHVFASLIVGSLPGILIGSYFAARVPEKALRLVLAAALIIVAAKLSFGLMPSSSDVMAEKTVTPR